MTYVLILAFRAKMFSIEVETSTSNSTESLISGLRLKLLMAFVAKIEFG